MNLAPEKWGIKKREKNGGRVGGSSFGEQREEEEEEEVERQESWEVLGLASSQAVRQVVSSSFTIFRPWLLLLPLLLLLLLLLGPRLPQLELPQGSFSKEKKKLG